MYGVDSWPLDWPGTLETIGQMTTSGSVVVPGHGPTTTVGAERTGNPFLTEPARPSRTGRAHADQD